MITIESKNSKDRIVTNRVGEIEYTISLKLYNQQHKVINSPYQECKLIIQIISAQ